MKLNDLTKIKPLNQLKHCWKCQQVIDYETLELTPICDKCREKNGKKVDFHFDLSKLKLR